MNNSRTELSTLIPLYLTELKESDNAEYINYSFSDSYMRKKKKIIRNQKRIYYPLIKTTGRRIASIIAAVLIMGTITAAAFEPVREAVGNFFISIFDNHSVVSTSEKTLEHKDKILYTYSFDIPEEFVLSETDVTDTWVNYVYTSDDSKHIEITQCTFDSYKSSIDNNNADLIEKTDKYGNRILVHNYNDTSVIIIWDNGEYIFEISGYMTEEELMNIYYSTK